MKKIMIVDDNEDLRNLIKRILGKQGFDVILADNGDDCLEKLGQLSIKPDLILLDIMMPGTPVSEIIEKINDTKIVYLSAVGVSQDNIDEMLKQRNVIDFIKKPFEGPELVNKIKELIDNKMTLLDDIPMYQSNLLTIQRNQYNNLINYIPKELIDQKILYITLNKTYYSLKERFQQQNILLDNITFIDAVSSQLHNVEDTENCYFVNSPQSLPEFSNDVFSLLSNNFDYVIFDSLNTLLTYQKSMESVMSFTKNLIDKINATECKGLFYLVKNEDQFMVDEISKIVENVIEVEKFQDPSYETIKREDMKIQNY